MRWLLNNSRSALDIIKRPISRQLRERVSVFYSRSMAITRTQRQQHMGKTYEALMRGTKENKINYLEPVKGASDELVPISDTFKHFAPAPEWYKELKARLLLATQNIPSKAILFTGTNRRAGCSHVAVEFALCLANDYKHRVLLIDVNVRKPNLHNIFSQDKLQRLDDLIQSHHQHLYSYRNIDQNLFVVTCNSNSNYRQIIDFFNSEQFTRLIDGMKSSFDYIIMDAPPVNNFSETKLLSSKVDGVILVAESGKSRRKVVLKAQKEIQLAGGKLVGLILNRRKYHIPNWLYKRL